MATQLIVENNYWNGYIPAMVEKINKRHLRHLHKRTVLPIIHAAVVHNIKVEGRPPFTPLSKAYEEYKKDTVPSTFFNRPKTPKWLGRYILPSMGQDIMLVRSRKLWHHLGTINFAGYDKAVYGIKGVEYAAVLRHGRPKSKGTVKIPRHTRRPYTRHTKKGSVHVRATEVAAHEKEMTIGRLPARNYMRLHISEKEAMSQAIGEYLMAPVGQKFVVIKSRIPFKANRHVKILKTSKVGRRLTA